MEQADWALLFERAQSEAVTFAKDDVILKDGVTSEHVYRVVQGRVRVEKPDRRGASTPTRAGRLSAGGAIVNMLEEGQTFGEMSYLDDESPCASCIANTDSTVVARFPKQALTEILAADGELSNKFYRQMAINVTQRLQTVSKAATDIREAPRGLATPANSSLPISAKKLLKVRHRLGAADSETMACMMSCVMITPSKRKAHGVVYVFESMLGFVTKIFGIKQHEVIHYSSISEALRENFTLKREDNAVEIVTTSNKSYVLYPQHCDDFFDAMHKFRTQHASKLQKEGRRKSLDLQSFETNPHRALPSEEQSLLVKLLEKATLEKFKQGETIIAEGSRPCTLFNIAKGRVAVEVQRTSDETQMNESVKILTLYEPAMFGEMSFLNGSMASATVVAEVDCEVWNIKAGQVEKALSAAETGQQALFYKHLATYLTARVRQLTTMVGENYAARDGQIMLEEVLSNAVFFALFKRFLSERQLVDQQLLLFLQELNEFLQMPANDDLLKFARALYSKFMQGGNAISVSASAKSEIEVLLASETLPPRDLFSAALSEVLAQLQTNAYNLFEQSAAFQQLLDLKAKESYVPIVTDFKLLQILGEGYEGKVLQARKKDCGVMYALKVLDKVILAQRSRRWQLHASRELECLIGCDHPYIVSLAFSFQTPQYLYMVQEHVPNHTLAQYLEAYEGRPVREEEVRFMLVELILALAHMHSKSIVYRDLKPANVIIDDGGHMRIVDMGMASRLDPETGRRKSVCGTQRYMAPEMKDRKPYDTSVDWYSLGKLTLDTHGRSPYSAEGAWWEPSGLHELIEGLLVRDPLKRLGCGRDGLRSIQRSSFFAKAGVDWAAFELRKVASPLRRAWYFREPDVTASRQFRNGEDINKVVEKLQHISLDSGGAAPAEESGPGMIPNWDHVNPRIVYDEYLTSPYHNIKASGL